MSIDRKMDWKKVVIAYEPVWAIAAKKSVSIEQVEEICEQIRKLVQEKVSEEVGDQLRIIYAGPVNESSCKVIIVQKNIDGFLVPLHVAHLLAWRRVPH